MELNFQNQAFPTTLIDETAATLPNEGTVITDCAQQTVSPTAIPTSETGPVPWKEQVIGKLSS
jgi:hypothetical protein